MAYQPSKLPLNEQAKVEHTRLEEEKMRTQMGLEYEQTVQNMACQGDLDAFLAKVLCDNSTSQGGASSKPRREDSEALSRFDFNTLECVKLAGIYYITRTKPFQNNTPWTFLICTRRIQNEVAQSNYAKTMENTR